MIFVNDTGKAHLGVALLLEYHELAGVRTENVDYDVGMFIVEHL